MCIYNIVFVNLEQKRMLFQTVIVLGLASGLTLCGLSDVICEHKKQLINASHLFRHFLRSYEQIRITKAPEMQAFRFFLLLRYICDGFDEPRLHFIASRSSQPSYDDQNI